MTIVRHLLAAASLTVIIVNLGIALVPVLLLALAKRLRLVANDSADHALAAVYRFAVRVDDWWFTRALRLTWSDPALPLKRTGRYLVIANHRSWLDIFLIQSALTRCGPLVKFLVKEQLRYVPILAQIFWAYAFPIVRRVGGDSPTLPPETRRQQDLEAVSDACRDVRRHPAALLNFVEGTRFTAAKQASRGGAYENVLPPRSGGLSVMVETLRHDIDGLVDLTLLYPRDLTFWRFLSGAPARIEIRGRIVAPDALPAPHATRAWINALWREKDETIGQWLEENA